MENENNKIDMVYLWCDGNDKEFRERKNSFLTADYNIKDEEVSGIKRFFDNEELRYSLRSLEKYAPWINHVYIVTDRQCPHWLNTAYEKVSIIDHSLIMPQEIIPCFNSNVIEYFLPKIPALSERFLYANDDFFLGRTVRSSDFFEDGMPIVRVKVMNKYKTLKKAKKVFLEYAPSDKAVLNAAEILFKEYGKDENDLFYVSHHNIDSYNKTAWLETSKKLAESLKLFLGNRFRSDNDVQRILFSLDAVYSGNAVLKIVSDPKPWRKALNFFKNVEWESYMDNDDSDKLQEEILKLAMSQQTVDK